MDQTAHPLKKFSIRIFTSQDAEKLITFFIANEDFRGSVRFADLQKDIDKWIEPAVRVSKTIIEVRHLAWRDDSSIACGHFCAWLFNSKVFPNLREIHLNNNYHLCWLSVPKPSLIHVRISESERTCFLPPVIENVRKLTVESKACFKACPACSHGTPLKEVTNVKPTNPQVDFPHLRKFSCKTFIRKWSTRLNCPSLEKVKCCNKGIPEFITGKNVTRLTLFSYDRYEEVCKIMDHKKIFASLPNVKTLILKSQRSGSKEGPFQCWKIPAHSELFKRAAVMVKCGKFHEPDSLNFFSNIQADEPEREGDVFVILEPTLP